ncbi:MAG TPA: metallophosphoesterase [Acidimicrobiales bacterium]|nr:metallophosphoesterase [Acidimicrobiales bacterium]
MCAPLDRRQFLRLAGLVAATPLLPRMASARVPLARAFGTSAAAAVPIHLELVTVTDTSAVLTWLTADPTKIDQFGRPAPVPAGTVVELGTSPSNLVRVIDRDDSTAFHYAELTGLEPGRPYWYRCSSNGVPAVPAQVLDEPPATGTFTTLVPPPGSLLLTMAWANDLHMGELVSGLAYSNSSLPGGGAPPGFTSPDPNHPYWQVMADAAVAESKERGASLLLLNGDLTSEAQPVYLDQAKATFDTFGTYRTDYFVTRGNHDRAHMEPGCTPIAPGSPYTDCLHDTFFPDGDTRFSFDRAGLHFAALDTVDLTTGNGSVPADEVEWLQEDLADHDGMPTFVFGHHPVSEEGRATTIGGPGFSLSQSDAQALEAAIAGTSVVGVYSGHTHRNKRSSSVIAPGVPFIELGAVKEYPGGFGLVRVYDGGYMVNFYKTRADEARAWSEQSRGEYLGLYPYYTLGTLADRNFTVTYP